MFHSILFDLDETLYPYVQFVFGGFRNAARWAARELGVDERLFYHSCIKEWQRQGNSGRIFDRVLAGLGLPETALPRLVEAFRSQEPRLRLYPDAQNFIAAMQGKACLGVVTDGLAAVQKHKIKALNISRHFKSIIYSDEFGSEYLKPSTIPYLAALQQLGSPPPEKTVYIGDNPYKDFAGAKKLGLYTIRLLRGQFRHAQVPAWQDAHAACTSFDEILRRLK